MKSGVQFLTLIFIIFVTQGFMSMSAFAGPDKDYFEQDYSYNSKFGSLNIRLVYPKQDLKWGDLFLQKTQAALLAVNSKLGLDLKDSIAIFFDPNPDQHNGLTTVVPDNRIIIHLEPPRAQDSIGDRKSVV
jgi:hypothetical protein